MSAMDACLGSVLYKKVSVLTEAHVRVHLLHQLGTLANKHAAGSPAHSYRPMGCISL